RRAGRGQRSGNLATDMSGLADAADDDPALGAREHTNRFLKNLAEAILKSGSQRRESRAFSIERAERTRNGWRCHVRDGWLRLGRHGPRALRGGCHNYNPRPGYA